MPTSRTSIWGMAGTKMNTHIILMGDSTEVMQPQLSKHFTLHRAGDEAALVDILAHHSRDIQGVATSATTGLSADAIAALPNLKVVSSCGVGYESIDATAAAARGVIVTHTPDVLNNDVADLALMLHLALSRSLMHDAAWLRRGAWAIKGSPPVARTASGRRVGILGLGRIGKDVARRFAALDCELSYHGRRPQVDVPYRYFDNLVEMAQHVETLIVVVPGGTATQGLVDRTVLDALGPQGTLINVARGSVVEEPALISALQEGRLGAAGLDVFADEPNVPQALIDMDRVILLPHVGSATRETRAAMTDLTINNLVQFFDTGEVLTPVPECAHLAAIRT